MSSSIWEEGFDAFKLGIDINDNPYPKDSPEYQQWENGWLDGDRNMYMDMDTK